MAAAAPGLSQGLSPWLWRLLAGAVALAVALPILTLFLQWGTLGSGEQEIWQHLFDTQLDRLALNTLVLLAGVAQSVRRVRRRGK
jgi:ABC-type Fe3+ transport system permease subunit